MGGPGDRLVSRPHGHLIRARPFAAGRRIGWGIAALGLIAAPGCGGHAVNPASSGPYGAEAAKTVPAVEHAVGLKFKRPPIVQSRSRAEVRSFLEREFGEARAAVDLAGTESAYKLLGLLPDTLHLRAELENLLTEQIVGFYDPGTKVLYVVDSAPSAQVSMVIAHELVHALQDQYFDLDSIEKLTGENDRQSAAQAVIEGQAVYDQLVAATGNADFIGLIPGGWDAVRAQIRENQSGMPAFANAPMALQEELLFPYLSGAEFMRHFALHDPGKQPYGALMPVSTKQILHPETAYFGAHPDLPRRVAIAPPANAADTVRYTNNMGELGTRLFLFQHLNDQSGAVRGAAGWEGDRYEVLALPHHQRALVWVTVWDSPVDAGQFRDMALRIASRRKASARGRTVTVTPIEIQGMPAVIYVDAPTGTSWATLVDTASLAVSTPGS